MHTMATTNTILTALMTPLTIIQSTFHEFFLRSTKAYYHQYQSSQSSHTNNHTKMTASMPFNCWANNIFVGYQQFISSLHFMTHFIFTLYSRTPLPPPYHPSPPQPTISTNTSCPPVAVLTLSFIFTSAPCSRRQMITSRCLFQQA
jgi:hypothetical protein